MTKWIVFIFIVFLPFAVAAQNDADYLLGEYLELYAEHYEQETDYDELQEILQHYLDNKINLNDTVASALTDLFFINEYHQELIRSYIRQNGVLITIDELYLVDKLDSTTIRLLMPFVVAEAVGGRKQPSLNYILRRAKHSVAIGAKTIVEPARGYTDSIYLGDPFRIYFRYRMTYSDKLLLSLSAEKDAGEEFFGAASPKGFGYYGFSLLLKNIGRMEQIAIGNYNVCLGQGLTMWSGSTMRFAADANIEKHGSNLRPASATAENGSLQGIAAKLRLTNSLALTAFLSYQRRDATNISVDSAGRSTFQSLYTSGYHRSNAEIEKKDRVGETIVGGNLQYAANNLSVGLSAYAQHFDAVLQPKENFYNHYSFSGTDNFNVGADVSYLWNNVMLFAETAFSPSAANATIAGVQIYIRPRTRLAAYYRRYSAAYCNMYSSALGQNTDNSNEQGLCSILEFDMPRQTTLSVSADVYKFPWPKYQIYSPGIGTEYRINLSKNLTYDAVLTARYRYRCRTANISNPANHISSTEERQTHNLYFHLRYTPTSSCTFNSRVAFSRISSPAEGDTSGFLIYHEAVYKPSVVPIAVALRYAIFQVDDYDARIYAYERDLPYECSTPAFSGKGSRFYILLTWDINQYASLGLRYAIALYADRATVGSGYDQTQGNKRQEIKLQLRCTI